MNTRFKDSAREALNKLGGHLFRGETLPQPELEKHFDTLQQLEHEYGVVLNALDKLHGAADTVLGIQKAVTARSQPKDDRSKYDHTLPPMPTLENGGKGD